MKVIPVMHIYTHTYMYRIHSKLETLEIRVLPEGLRFYPEPFASEEPFFEERVLQGFFVRQRVPWRILFIQRTLFEERVLQGLLKAWVLKDPQPQIFKCLPAFQMVFLNVDSIWNPLNQFIYLCSAIVDIFTIILCHTIIICWIYFKKLRKSEKKCVMKTTVNLT